MTAIEPGRYTAAVDGPFVVFLVGMRFNGLRGIPRALKVFAAMPRMLRELRRRPGSGLLGHQTLLYWPGAAVIQYWRSFDDLERYAHDRGGLHRPAWAAFNREIGADGSVGIWHETYLVDAGRYEAIYVNMPRFGLAAAAAHEAITPVRDAARDRLMPD